MVPAFDQAAWAAKVGEITEPIKTQYGYHIIQVEKKNGFEEAKPEIDKKIRPALAREGVEDTRKNAKVVFDESFFGPDPAKAAPEAPKQ
jgi:foldase protein PrsA